MVVGKRDAALLGAVWELKSYEQQAAGSGEGFKNGPGVARGKRRVGVMKGVSEGTGKEREDEREQSQKQATRRSSINPETGVGADAQGLSLRRRGGARKRH